MTGLGTVGNFVFSFRQQIVERICAFCLVPLRRICNFLHSDIWFFNCFLQKLYRFSIAKVLIIRINQTKYQNASWCSLMFLGVFVTWWLDS